MNRCIGFGLCNVDQLLTRKFKQREECDDKVLQIGVLGKQRREFTIASRQQHLQKAAHLRANRQLLARYEMVTIDSRPLDQHCPGRSQVLRRHIRKSRWRNALEKDANGRKIAFDQRQRIKLARCLLHSLVFQQTANELGAGIGRFVTWRRGRTRQQQARLYFDQHRSHQQIFGGELELRPAHHLHVAQILARQLGHRDVEHIDVLPPDQIQQQIKRTFECFQKDLERFRRNVEIVRKLVDRFAIDARQRPRQR